MKPLILSFFGAILIYSLFFDKDANKEENDPQLHLNRTEYEQKVLKMSVDSVANFQVVHSYEFMTESYTK